MEGAVGGVEAMWGVGEGVEGLRIVEKMGIQGRKHKIHIHKQPRAPSDVGYFFTLLEDHPITKTFKE